MRIPNLNVSQSVTQKIRDLDLERFKLDKQITTGQKISLPEDGGLTMSRVIQLDSTKSRLAQYQRNSSYATEFINAGHLNLEKLRDINQRAQEIARLSGSNLNGPAVEAYGLEIDQLIEESINRVNSTQRGRALFGGTALKPDFAHSDVVLGQSEKKILDLQSNPVGISEVAGQYYLKQGDEVILRANGREYVVQAKLDQISLYNSAQVYNKGAQVVNVETSDLEDGILVDAKFTTQSAIVSLFKEKAWSVDPVGVVQDGGHPVYSLSFEQLEDVAVSLGAQPSLDFFPQAGGYFAIVENGGSFLLEPVENEVGLWSPTTQYNKGDFVKWGQDIYKSRSDIEVGSDFSELLWEKQEPSTKVDSFKLTTNESLSYWRATRDEAGEPSFNNENWININPYERASNVSVDTVTQLLRDLINADPFFLADSKVVDSDSYTAFSRASSRPGDYRDESLDLRATISSNGQLEVLGTVGHSFALESEYSSRYDTRNYFPVQLEQLLEEKAKSIYSVSSYAQLSESEKQIVWQDVQDSVLTWDLNVQETAVDSDSLLTINLAKPWKRLEVYNIGEIIEFEGRRWESQKDENFNHLPTQSGSEYWKEIGSGYSEIREDWALSITGNDSRLFWVSPDGKLFNGKSEAFTHTIDILTQDARINPDSSTDLLDSSGNLSNNKIRDKAASLIDQVAYPISQFNVDGSESNGIISFDVESQSFRLAVQDPNEDAVEGSFMKGVVFNKTSITPPPTDLTEDDPVSDGDVVQFRGSYYIVTDNNISRQVIEGSDVTDSDGNPIPTQEFGETISTGEKFFDPESKRIYIFVGDSLPTEGSEPFVQPGTNTSLRSGSFVYLSDLVTNDTEGDSGGFYLATSDITNAGSEEVLDPETGLPYPDATQLVKVSAFNSPQGLEWSSNKSYFKGQIVLHDGIYYECQTNGVDGNGFNNQRDEEETVIGIGRDGSLEQQFIPIIGSPSDEFFKEGLSDARDQEYIDLLKAKGEAIANNVWIPVSKPLQHVFSFDVSNQIDHEVKIASSGKGGIDAKISVLSDIDGKVFGLRVDHPGRYFFPRSEGTQKIPEEYRTAYVTMNDGQSFEAKILWDENPNDPGPFVIAGLEITSEQEFFTDQPMGARKGDSFSLATGRKTFLDHRDNQGNVVNVTYTGTEDNAEFFVGNESKISSFLDASEGNTAELANVVESLVELRNGLKNSDLSEMAQIVQSLESELISNEESVVDKMGELSSILVRMNTVRAHDEEYHLEIDQRLAKDLDIDLSEAIMQLTRVSTAYQAAMQVGAQLLNTSLLNYL
jgi:flagellin-like hook-associated protein FlgL